MKFKDVSIPIPALREQRPAGPLVLGVRPEHIRFSDSAPVRGRVFGAEYLGTTQIVTVTTEQGTVKARLPSGQSPLRTTCRCLAPLTRYVLLTEDLRKKHGGK